MRLLYLGNEKKHLKKAANNNFINNNLIEIVERHLPLGLEGEEFGLATINTDLSNLYNGIRGDDYKDQIDQKCFRDFSVVAFSMVVKERISRERL